MAVLRAIAETGGANAAAVSMNRSVKTLQTHITSIHKKMGTSSTVRCVLLAERAGLLVGVE